MIQSNEQEYIKDELSVSLHSTFSVGEFAKDGLVTEEEELQAEPRRHSSVRFGPNMEFGGEQILYDDEIEQCWYHPQDYEMFAHEARETIQAIQETESGCRQDDASYMNVMEDVWEACCNVKQEDNVTIAFIPQPLASALASLFIDNGHEEEACHGIGLEKHAVEFIHLIRVNRRRRLQTLVARLQDTQDDHALAKTCEKLTRAARIFAHCLAAAQQQQ